MHGDDLKHSALGAIKLQLCMLFALKRNTRDDDVKRTKL
jgi:hypothetical protein